jgi:hypothetical protein
MFILYYIIVLSSIAIGYSCCSESKASGYFCWSDLIIAIPSGEGDGEFEADGDNDGELEEEFDGELDDDGLKDGELDDDGLKDGELEDEGE